VADTPTATPGVDVGDWILFVAGVDEGEWVVV